MGFVKYVELTGTLETPYPLCLKDVRNQKSWGPWHLTITLLSRSLCNKYTETQPLAHGHPFPASHPFPAKPLRSTLRYLTVSCIIRHRHKFAGPKPDLPSQQHEPWLLDFRLCFQYLMPYSLIDLLSKLKVLHYVRSCTQNSIGYYSTGRTNHELL